MNWMKVLLFVSAIALFGFVVMGAAPVCHADVTTLTSQNDPAGARGQVITWSVKLLGDGRPLANMPVVFTWRSDARGAQPITTVTTDGAGVAKISFRIPTNPADDNVILKADFSVPPGYVGIPWSKSTVSQRIRISR